MFGRRLLVIAIAIVFVSLALYPAVRDNEENRTEGNAPNGGTCAESDEPNFISGPTSAPGGSNDTVYEYFSQNLTQTLEDISNNIPTLIHFYQRDAIVDLELDMDMYSADPWVGFFGENGSGEEPAPLVAYYGIILSPEPGEAHLVIAENWIQGYAEFGNFTYFNEVATIGEAPPSTPYKAWRYNVTSYPMEAGVPGNPSTCSRDNSLVSDSGGRQDPTVYGTPPGPEPLQMTEQRIGAWADYDLYRAIQLQKPGCGGEKARGCTTYWLISEIVAFNYRVYQREVSIYFMPRYYAICWYLGLCGLDSHDAVTLWNQFNDLIDEWYETETPIVKQIHVAHLFSGKDLNGLVYGVGAGRTSLSQQVKDPNPASLYAADPYQRMIVESHEIGHTYDAEHRHAQVIWLCWWSPACIRFSIMWGEFMGWLYYPVFSETNEDLIRHKAATRGLWRP